MTPLIVALLVQIVIVSGWLLLIVLRAAGVDLRAIRNRLLFRLMPGSRAMLCRVCGYDLRASRYICPECGTKLGGNHVVPATRLPPRPHVQPYRRRGFAW